MILLCTRFAMMLTFLIPGSAVLSQTKSEVLIAKYDNGGSRIHDMAEYGMILASSLDKDPELFALIRVCTNRDLLIAVGRSSIDPISLAWFLANNPTMPKISADRVFVERDPRCRKNDYDLPRTEIWVTKFLSSDAFPVCRLERTEYRSKYDANIIVGTSRPTWVFDRLLTDISKGQQSAGVVIGYTNIDPPTNFTSKLKSLSRRADKTLVRNKVGFYKQLWNREDEVGRIRHLEIVGIRITEACKVSGQKPRVLIVE